MTELHSLFIEISLVLVVATVIAGIMQLLKQPIIIGHIITGLIVGPYFLNLVGQTENITIFSQLGTTLLLFIVGLSLSPLIIKEVGRPALIAGLAQIAMTTGVGYATSRWLGLPVTTALFFAIALSFSSTIIILKLLSDQKDLSRLHGKLATGLLLVQDVAATIVLIVLTATASGGQLTDFLTMTTIKLAGLAALLIGLSIFVLPRFSRFFAKSQEFLFLFSISWGLGLAALFHALGFSIEIGALCAGVALASSPYNYEISARMRPLRDFFVIIFFILIGSQVALNNITNLWQPIIALSILVLVVKPIITMLLISWLGYNKQTSFKTGLTTGQVSEFSLIFVLLGQKLGYLNSSEVSIITIVGLITIAISSYSILNLDKVYPLFSRVLTLLGNKKVQPERLAVESHEIILFGYDTIGYDFVRSFKKLGSKFLIVDYDPEIIARLTDEKVNCKYGDANDNEFLDELNLKQTKMIVSTILDFEANMLLVGHAKQANRKMIIIVKSDNIEEASELYDKGATYVMMPHYLGSNYASMLIDKHGFDFSQFIQEKERHIHYIERRQKTAL